MPLRALRLFTNEDDATPLLLGLAAVNGDLRLYSEYLASLCREGSGGARRLACRFLEHLATLKEPLLALEKLAEELGGSNILYEVTRSLRLGVEPSEVAERIVERIIARMQARASLIDDVARAMLEVLALVSTVLSFSILMTGLLAGGAAPLVAPLVITLVVVVSAALTPSIVRLGAPRVPRWLAALSMLSVAVAAASLYYRSLTLALVSMTVMPLVAVFTLAWWKQTRSVAELAVAIAESMQFGRGLFEYGRGDRSLAYRVAMGSKHGVKSSLAELLIDMLRLLPQEGSVTAARLLRSFAEFASRYLELVKSALTKSLVYEALVTTTMPILVMLAAKVLSFTVASPAAPLPLAAPRLADSTKALALMSMPAVFYPLATSKIGRGTPLLPLLHPLAALLTLLATHP